MKSVSINCGYHAERGMTVKMKGLSVVLTKLSSIYKKTVATHPVFAVLVALVGMPIAAVGAVFFFTFIFSMPLLYMFG